MHKDRILKLADTIEKCESREALLADFDKPDIPGFSMRRAWYDCDSPSCIIGWTYQMFGDGKKDAETAKLLGIPRRKSISLTMPSNRHAHWCARPGQYNYVTPEHAAAVLRNLAETGEVDWRVGAKDV